ncbi:MAG: RNA polymerase sigma factor [Cyclobacteriaceae bacterium]
MIRHFKSLASELVRGNKRALELLYEENAIRIFNLAYRMTSSRGDAEEIVQDTFLRLWNSRKKIDVSRELTGYIIVIARNLSIDKIKTNSKKIDSCDYDTLENLGISTKNSFYYQEASRELDEAIDRLPPKRKQVFQLKVGSTLTNKEIARKLNVSEATVEKHMRLASNALRDMLSSSE